MQHRKGNKRNQCGSLQYRKQEANGLEISFAGSPLGSNVYQSTKALGEKLQGLGRKSDKSYQPDNRKQCTLLSQQ